MQKGINKVILVGNLGNNPEVKAVQAGGNMAILSVATSESWKDKQTGNPMEKTEWHRVVIFGKLADIAQQYLKKGSKVYIEGKLQTRKWQDQQGQDRYSTEVVLDFGGQLQMLDRREEGSQPSSQNAQPMNNQAPVNQDQPTSHNTNNASQKAPDFSKSEVSSFDELADDIPF